MGTQTAGTSVAIKRFNTALFTQIIGRNAFQPLDQGDLQSKTDSQSSDLRIIGVARDGDAHAYSVRKLRYHETANTFLGAAAITAAY